MRAAILAGVLAACSFPTKTLSNGLVDASTDGPPGPDAPRTPDASPGLACITQPLPTTAPPQIVVSGSLYNIMTGMPVPNGNIQVMPRTATNLLAQQATDANGNYTITLPTNGVPLDVRFHASVAGFVDTWYYPPVPLVKDTSVTPSMVDNMTYPALGQLCGGVTVDTTMTQMFVATVDCANNGLANATVAVMPTNPNTQIRYYTQGGTCNTTGTDTTGTVFVYNAPPTNMVLTGAQMGTPLRQTSVSGVGGTVTEAFIQ
jgi:hypothetical protein